MYCYIKAQTILDRLTYLTGFCTCYIGNLGIPTKEISAAFDIELSSGLWVQYWSSFGCNGSGSPIQTEGWAATYVLDSKDFVSKITPSQLLVKQP